MKLRNLQKKILFFVVVIASVLLVDSHMNMNVNAEEERRTVRVGYVLEEGYQEGKEGEYKTGYGYEYYQKLSYYANWEYEYVYGSFSELMERLESGEIDIMGNLYYTEELAEKIYYSTEEQGRDNCYIYIPADCTYVDPADYSTLEGMRIGVVDGSDEHQMLKKWCADNDVNCKIVQCSNMVSFTSAITSDVMDGVVMGSVVAQREMGDIWKPVVRVGSTPFYFGVTKEKPTIIKELNEAQMKILSANRFYNEEVHSKYVKDGELISSALDSVETEWLKNHGAIRVGYMYDLAPFCNKDSETGELVGAASAFLECASNMYNIPFETYMYTSYADLIQALKDGDIDVVIPVIQDYWSAEKRGVALTDAVTTSRMMVLYLGEYNSSLMDRIAITASSPFSKTYTQIMYPDSELIEYEDIWACIEAVQNGEVSCTVYNASCYHVDKYVHPLFDELRSTALGESINLSMAVRKGDTELLSILNKAVENTPHSLISDALVASSYVKEKMTFSRAVKNHLPQVIIGTTAFISTVIILFAVYIYISKKNRRNLLKINEEANKARKEAEEANKAKSTFLFNMSHDIRTPMNAIVGFTERAQKHINEQEEVSGCLEKIRVSSKTLLRLINQVLNLARIENSDNEIQREIVSVYEFESDLRAIFEGEMKHSGIRFDMNTEVEKEHFLMDRTKMTQICVNLLGNALKFTPTGGTVTYQLKQNGSIDAEGFAQLEMLIKDTGIGMSEEFLQRAFEAFARERTSTVSGIQGTGLGLTIVKKLCDTVDAYLDVSSAPGKGTEFHITFWAQISEAPETIGDNNQDATDGYEFTGKRALLVEDNALNRELAIDILEEGGFEVESAVDGSIAVEMVEKSEPGYYDVILMDIQMAIMDGYTATEKIRAISNTELAGIPIVAMTANAFEEDKKKALDVGMDDFVAKPIDIDALYTTLHKVLKD